MRAALDRLHQGTALQRLFWLALQALFWVPLVAAGLVLVVVALAAFGLALLLYWPLS